MIVSLVNKSREEEDKQKLLQTIKMIWKQKTDAQNLRLSLDDLEMDILGAGRLEIMYVGSTKTTGSCQPMMYKSMIFVSCSQLLLFAQIVKQTFE